MRSQLTAIVLALFLAGCSTLSSIKIPQFIEHAQLQLQDPAPVTISPVHWKVINDQATPFIALTPQEFQQLSTDLAKTDLYIRQLHQEVDSYKKYYEPAPEMPSK